MTSQLELEALRQAAKEKNEQIKREKEAQRLREELEQGTIKGNLKSSGKKILRNLFK